MKYLLSLSFFLLGLLATLSAQHSCPQNQLVTIALTQDTVTVELPDPVVDSCPADTTVFTINGATSAWGLLTTNKVLLNAGTNEVSYFNCANIENKVSEVPQLLPDGNGVEYSIPFTVSGFPEGSTVGPSGQPIVICATMEHSYLGDLEIWLACPDGTQWILHQYNPDNDVRRQLLGRGNQQTDTPDPAYQYCWRVGATYTFTEYIEQENLGSNQSLPAGTYAPEDDLSVIADCIVNGEWSLNFRDNLVADNGSVAAWSVTFESPKTEKCSYTIEVKQRPVSAGTLANLPGLELAVTPNPFDRELTLNTRAVTAEMAELSVYTISGQEMLQQSVSLAQGEHRLSFKAENWPAGIYFLRLRTEEGEIVRKIVRR